MESLAQVFLPPPPFICLVKTMGVSVQSYNKANEFLPFLSFDVAFACVEELESFSCGTCNSKQMASLSTHTDRQTDRQTRLHIKGDQK